MKKFLFLVIPISLILSGCTQTDFEDLSEEKQKEIANYFYEKSEDIVEEMMSVPFDSSLSNTEIEQKMDELEDELKDIYETKLKAEYSSVNFKSYENFSDNAPDILSDSSDVETTDDEDFESVSIWDFWTFVDEDDSDKKSKVKIRDYEWAWSEVKLWYLNEFTATNEFLKVKLESENIWKKPNAVYIRNAKLITDDGYEYNISRTVQASDSDYRPDWYSGCISCSSNPWDKDVEYLLFDIEEVDLSWAYIRFEDYMIDLML